MDWPLFKKIVNYDVQNWVKKRKVPYKKGTRIMYWANYYYRHCCVTLLNVQDFYLALVNSLIDYDVAPLRNNTTPQAVIDK